MVTRIGDVRGLRAHQFVEDAGPLAHPVRPELYREINNFYTTTVYEKGAEVVRMIHTLLGPELFRKGMDLYFERHDGEAATVEQFVQCFADVSKRDLKQFMRWYSQAGTPEVVASGHYDAARQDLQARSRPGDPADAGPADQGADGHSARHRPGRPRRPRPAAHARRRQQDRARRAGAGQGRRRASSSPASTERPVLSINRNFSAPIKLTANLTADDLRLMAAHDSDPFNRWQAVQTLASALLVGNVARLRAGQDPEVDEGLLDALAAILADKTLEPAFVAEALQPAERSRHRPRDRPRRRSGRDLPRPHGAARADRAASQRRADRDLSRAWPTAAPTARTPSAPAGALLKNVCLDLLAATQESHAIRLAAQQYQAADNMTDRMAALATLSLHDVPERKAAFDDFYQRYQRRSADHRQVVRVAGDDARPRDARPRPRADRASGLLDDQPQPRALADRLVRPGQPDAVQPRRRRRLRIRRRPHPGARSGQSAGRLAA